MNEKDIWDFLLDKIKNEYGVAGLMGNLKAESGLNPKNVQNSSGYEDEWYTESVDNGSYTREQFINDSIGYGLAQWTSSGRKENLYNRKEDSGVSIGDLNLQLNFLISELGYGYPEVLEVLKNATSTRQASDKVLFDFESPADQSESVQIYRNDLAVEIYEKFAGTTPPEPPEPPEASGIYDLILKTSYPIKSLSDNNIAILKKLNINNTCKIQFSFFTGKKKYGTNLFGNKIKKTNAVYTIFSVKNNGFVELRQNENAIPIYINPVFILDK